MDSILKKPEPSVNVGSNLVKVIRALAKEPNYEQILKNLAPNINFHQMETYSEYIDGEELERESDTMSSLLRALDEKSLICLIHDNMFVNKSGGLIDVPFNACARSGRVDFLRESFNKYYLFIQKQNSADKMYGWGEQIQIDENGNVKENKKTKNSPSFQTMNFNTALKKIPLGVYDSCYYFLQHNFSFEEYFLSNTNDAINKAIEQSQQNLSKGEKDKIGNKIENSEEYKQAKFQGANSYFEECKAILLKMQGNLSQAKITDKKHLEAEYRACLKYVDFLQVYARASILGIEGIEEHLKDKGLRVEEFINYFIEGVIRPQSNVASYNEEPNINHNGTFLIRGLEENLCQSMSLENFKEFIDFLKKYEDKENNKESKLSDKINGLEEKIQHIYSVLVQGQFRAWNKNFKTALKNDSGIVRIDTSDFNKKIAHNYGLYDLSREKMILLCQNVDTKERMLNLLGSSTYDMLSGILKEAPLSQNYLNDLAQFINPNFEFEFNAEYDVDAHFINEDGRQQAIKGQKIKKLKFIDIVNLAYYADFFTQKPLGYDDEKNAQKTIDEEESNGHFRKALAKNYHALVYQYKKAGIDLLPASSLEEFRKNVIAKYSLAQPGPDNVADFFNTSHGLFEVIDSMTRGFDDLHLDENRIKLDSLFLKEKLSYSVNLKPNQQTLVIHKI